MGIEDVETQTIAPKSARRPAPALARGACVGRYVILDRLGVGGMGVVYRAYDPDLDRRIALKLVRTISEDSTARLVREAQALAKVSHPNIVQIFDVGMFGDTVFIAMELVEGQTLSQWKRAQKPAWRAMLAHLIEAGRGLAAAHAAGLVHRDFKPQNAIVGADGRVRVLDFGVARQVRDSKEIEAVPEPPEDDAGVAEAELPQIIVSRITGTPVYMAPEQQRHGALDARADQFAFAVTCWELLHGERPFLGDDLRSYLESSASGRFRAAPSSAPTPAWVRKVLTRALAAQPADRYRSVDEVLAALSADPARRRRRFALAAAAVVGIVAVVALVATRSAAPAPCPDAARHLDGVWDDAVAARLDQAFRATGASFAGETADKVRAALATRATAWAAMHRAACRATRVTGEQSAALLDLRMGCLARRRDELHALVEQLATHPDTARISGAIDAVGHLPSVDTCADREALAAVVPLPADVAQRTAIDDARSELARIQALLWTGQWPEARTRAEAAQGRARAIGWAPLIAEAAFVRGQAERNAGNFPAAETALTEAVEAAARAHLDEVSAPAWSDLAWVVGYEEERPLEGLALAGAAEAIALRADASPKELAAVAHTRAQLLSTKGDQAGALREAERAIALLPSSPDRTEADDDLNTVAMIESSQGDYAKAEATLRTILASRRATFGERHPKVADSLDNLGVVRSHQGANDEARRDYEEALAIRVAALGPDHRDVGTSHNNLGGLLMETGDPQGAAKHLEAALAIYEKALGPDHADLAIPLSNLGELATRRGDYERAIGYCERALKLDEATGPEDPKLAYDLVCVGEAQLGRKRPREARVALERALHFRDGKDGDAGELARTRFDLARALWSGSAADRTRARALATTARDGFAAAGDAWKARHAEAIAWLRAPT